LAARGRWPRVTRNVWLLGVTSLLTDVSSEMFAAVLPLYVMMELRLTPLHLGLVDGIYQGASAIVRVAAGTWADAGGRYKGLAVIGYGISACSRAGLIFSSGWMGLMSFVMADRLGKGVRTAPRDALLALSSDPRRLGEAFGVHRTLDAIGALFGPLIAFAVLAVSAQAFDAVFVVSLAFAVVGLAVLVLFVENQRRAPEPAAPRAWSRMVRVSTEPRFRRILVAGSLLGLSTTSDALLYASLQQRGAIAASAFPLLFVGTSAIYLSLALPFGRIGDRVGQGRVFIAGHLGIAAIYAVLGPLQSQGLAGVFLTVIFLGAYYAATDGVLAALAATVLPRADVATGLACVSTAVALARLLAAVSFGAAWNVLGEFMAMTLFLGWQLTTVVVAAWCLHERHASPLEPRT
jgi:MFS family permease